MDNGRVVKWMKGEVERLVVGGDVIGRGGGEKVIGGVD